MFAIGDKVWPGISKLNEEAGEVIQVIGKIMGTRGQPKHWSGKRLTTRLEDELGDLLAAIDFVLLKNKQLNRERIQARRKMKLATFKKWHSTGDKL